MSSYPIRMAERKTKPANLLKTTQALATQGLAIKPSEAKVKTSKVTKKK